MTPTHLSMSHEGKEILRKMTEGLDESEIRLVMLSAKQMLSISAYVAAVEKERDELRAALEKIAKQAMALRGEQAYREFARFAQNTARAALKGDAK